MGEILKAAGCSYDNGERSGTLKSIFKFDINVKKVFSLNTDLNTFFVIVSCSCQDYRAPSRHERL